MSKTTKEPIGGGTTTLDLLRVRYEWLGNPIDTLEKESRDARAELKAERAKVAVLTEACEAADEFLSFLDAVPTDGRYEGLVSKIEAALAQAREVE